MERIVVVTFLVLGMIIITPSYAQSFDITGLKAYYKFDETSGNLLNLSPSIDSLGSNADGVLVGPPTRDVAGLIKNTYDFNGSTDYIDIQFPASQWDFLSDANKNQDFTFNLWFDIDAYTAPLSSSPRFFYGFGSAQLNGESLGINNGNMPSRMVSFTQQDFPPQVITKRGQSSDGFLPQPDTSWHMLTVSYDGTKPLSQKFTFYLDGGTLAGGNQEVKPDTATVNAPHAFSHTGTNVWLGLEDSNPLDPRGFIDGKLDEYSIWDRVLTDQEVADLYNNGAGLELDLPMCNGIVATIVGTAGDDVIVGTKGDDVIAGLEGNDIIMGKRGNDVICGDDGNDQIFGNAGADTIFGGEDVDFIEGNRGNDTIFGDDGDDIITGNRGADIIEGGNGDDLIFGNESADSISGGEGNDTISGGAAGDTISGDAGNDKLLGDAGKDTLDGGTNDPLSADICIGGRGMDTEINCEVIF